MQSRHLRAANRLIAGVLAFALFFFSAGCAAMFRGTSQTVTLATVPSGGSVFYQGIRFSDGDAVTVRKRLATPMVVPDDGAPAQGQPMSYNPDPLLIADAALLLFFFIPGAIALGVDFGTGAWRDLDERQVIHVGRGRGAERPEVAASPEPETSSDTQRHPIEP